MAFYQNYLIDKINILLVEKGITEEKTNILLKKYKNYHCCLLKYLQKNKNIEDINFESCDCKKIIYNDTSLEPIDATWVGS